MEGVSDFPRTTLSPARLRAGLAAALVVPLTMTLAAGASPTAYADRSGPAGQDRAGAPDGSGGTVLGVPQHSSDDAWDRSDIAPRAAGCTPPRRSIDRSWKVTRGLTGRRWDRVVDGRAMRVSQLTLRLRNRRLQLDYLGPRVIGNRVTTSTLAGRADAVAAVNADFFDISDTGAPLGMGVDRRRGVLHGAKHGWVPELGYQPALWVKDGVHIGSLRTHLRMKQHPRWRLDALNAPLVREEVIGVYTRAWGSTSGVSVTNGEQGREVVVRRGRVVSNRRGLSANRKIRGAVLVGRGARARQLRSLKVGQRVTLTREVAPVRPRMAISGDRPLLEDGRIVVVNDTVEAPRTAVGIDRDTRSLILLAVDGRQSFSCGATMVGLARLMRRLGADDALNLDGGGSTSMWTARRRNGSAGLVNSPSDGSERTVANALGITRR